MTSVIHVSVNSDHLNSYDCNVGNLIEIQLLLQYDRATTTVLIILQ